MRKFNIQVESMKKTFILSMMFLLLIQPTDALVGYSSMTEIFDQSEFMVTGTVSESALIGDTETFFVCGKLLTINNPTIHWRDEKKTDQPKSMKVAYFDIGNTQINYVGERVLIIGKTLDLSNSDRDVPNQSGVFSPQNPYITTKTPNSSKDIIIDCSALYPDDLRYEAQIKFDITNYQLTSRTRSSGDVEASFDVVSIRSERLGLLQNPIFAKGMLGLKNDAGRTILCTTKEACQNELEHLRATVEKNMFGNFLFSTSTSGYSYLIDVNTLFEAYDAYRSEKK